MDLSERLQSLRKKAGYSQEQAAELLGISRQAVSKWESGQGKPDLDHIIKLTEIYNVSADYILSGKKQSAVSAHPEKKLSHTAQKTLGIIAIIAATAVITVLFITALSLLNEHIF
ncbi:MAG: helix-turn-helix transcriptional regulator [Lachnospiraceae bacterium]|nr:helix-turn-helix transcriptional regulator [Lachnospiraceae bacterium]